MTSSSVELSEIERIVIKQFLASIGVSIESETDFFSDLSIRNREFTGVGFVTDLELSVKLQVSEKSESYKWSDLGAKLNSSIDTGYLVYVENGYVTAIEGYTYVEDWPCSIFKIETYAKLVNN
jgi:hypothetical protein